MHVFEAATGLWSATRRGSSLCCATLTVTGGMAFIPYHQLIYQTLMLIMRPLSQRGPTRVQLTCSTLQSRLIPTKPQLWHPNNAKLHLYHGSFKHQVKVQVGSPSRLECQEDRTGLSGLRSWWVMLPAVKSKFVKTTANLLQACSQTPCASKEAVL